MTKICEICGKSILDGQRVHVGALTTFKEIPSTTSWAIDKPKEYTFIHHAACEDLE